MHNGCISMLVQLNLSVYLEQLPREVSCYRSNEVGMHVDMTSIDLYGRMLSVHVFRIPWQTRRIPLTVNSVLL